MIYLVKILLKQKSRRKLRGSNRFYFNGSLQFPGTYHA